jgi:hypothetical protein
MTLVSQQPCNCIAFVIDFLLNIRRFDTVAAFERDYVPDYVDKLFAVAFAPLRDGFAFLHDDRDDLPII